MRVRDITTIIAIVLVIVTHVRAWCENSRFTDIGSVICVDYSPDAALLMTTTATQVTIWERVTKQILWTKTVSAKCAKFSKDKPSSYIAIFTTGLDVQVYSGISPYASLYTITTSLGGGSAGTIDINAAGQLIVCGGTNNKVRTYILGAAAATLDFDGTYVNALVCKFQANTKLGIATSSGNKLDFMTLTTPSTLTSAFFKNLQCNDIDFSADLSYMIAGCSTSGKNGVFIQISSGTQTDIITTANMLSSEYSMDGQTFAYGGADKILYILNGTSANKTIMSQFLQNSNVQDTDFTDDGMYLAAGTADGTVYEYIKYCLTCRPGYWTNLVSKTCDNCETSIQGCSFCSNSSVCLQCYQNYIIDTGTGKCLSCSALMTGCSTCMDSTTCRYCSPGYYLSATICTTCQSSIIGCYICNASNYCTECESDFYLDTVSHTCKGCETVNVNCIKCSSATTCTSCKIGYYEQAGGCTACSTNCYACQTATNCTDCLTGYYPLLSGGSITCARCATGCLACNATGQCKDCADDRYQDGSGNCVQCPSPCVTCNASAYCLSCQVSYFSDGAGGCTACSSGCVTCNSSSYCLSCSPGFYLDTVAHSCKQCELSSMTNCMECTNTTCLKCQIGFYLSSSTTCSSCLASMNACVSCQSAILCSFCAAGYYLSTGTGNSSCQICPLGCTSCLASNNCTSCNVGYYYTSTTSTCSPCAGNCHTCTTSTACLECEIGYRLGAAGACVSCSLDISGCQSCIYNYTTSALWCVSCQLGKYIDSTGQCAGCPTNCTTCANGSYCLTCEIGQYVDSGTHLCTACNSNCSQCQGSATNCSSCIASYYLTAASKCEHCSAFGCATCNSSTHDCLSCQLGFYLKTVMGPPTKICENCLSAITNCYVCSSSTSCLQCSYGYAISSSSSACLPCSSIQGCKHCAVLTSCQNCEIGYYLTIDGSGNGVCSDCPLGCKECDSTGVCVVCSAGYSLLTGPVSCKLCESSMEGCLICVDTSTCQTCLPGYYLDTGTNKCKLCSDPMVACQYCNSSILCTHCQDGFYLSTSDTCSPCANAMVGCQLCNSSTVCLSCQFGMYMNSDNCYPCITSLPSCLYCLDLNTCLQCDAGYYISATMCQNCEAHITGCMTCNSGTQCLQCRGGYYLNAATQLCSACTHQGCEVCKESDPLKCVKCNARYYMNSTLNNCILCRTQIPGCLECVNSTRCKDCDPGYFVNALYQCQLCSTSLNGCGRCTSSATCLQCKSGYYIHTDNTCRQCKLQMPGCSYCINSTACQSCYHGYYKNALSLCQDCTSITGCLSCLNSTYCQYCQTSYFLQLSDNKCYPCNVLQGCYACTSNRTCAICTGGYIINDNFLCQVMRVQAYEKINDLKLVTKYLNQSCLVHYLYAKSMTYTQANDINWVKTTKLVLEDNKYNQVDLNIIRVQWGPNAYTLIIYTDNPLQLDQNNFELIKSRRLLLDGALASKYKVNLRMDQKTINTILPQFYLPKDLVMGYDIGSPEFVMSYANSASRFLFYAIFGYAITGLLLLKYLFKATYSVPGSTQMGDILPQIASLKAPAFIIYPSFMQFVFYCSGFMLPDIPWANQFMGHLFADTSDKTPQPYALFYANMNIGSTYFLALIVQIVIGFVLWMLYKSKQHDQYREKFPIGVVLYHFFIFGATWAGCACFQGALLNPIQTVNLNSGLYMVGIAFYCLILAYSLREVYIDSKNMYKIRVFIKASLLSAANISPIYIFCAAVLVDLVLLIIEYHFAGINRYSPKVWIAKNILCDLSLCVLAFLPSMMLSLIIASFLIVVVILLDIYTHIKQYKEANKRKKFQTKNLSENQSTVDVNVWNINFDKDNSPIEQQKIHEDPGRKTGFGNTKQSFMTSDANGFKREQRRKKHRQTKDKEDAKPDVLNIRDLQNTIKNKRRDFQEQDNNETFVASNFLK